MKNYLSKLILTVFTCLCSVSCAEDQLLTQSIVGNYVDAVLDFGTTKSTEVSIKTRSTYASHYESMVRNLYVMIFANGNKIYGRYFDANDLDKTTAKEYWTVNNMTSDNSAQTNGSLHMSVPTVSTDAEIVLIANIDLDFLNLSKERLGLIRSKEDLQDMIVTLNQEIPDRNAGYFMMTGSKSGVTISKDGKITVPGGKVMLNRLDAKIEVNVRINPYEETNRQKVEEFTPESWQVINLPKSSFLTPNEASISASFYNLSPKNFETTENEVYNGASTGAILHGFSFYSLENLRSDEKKKSVGGNYHHRDRRIKHLDDVNSEDYGTYDTENGMWEYAPEKATYIVIKG